MKKSHYLCIRKSNLEIMASSEDFKKVYELYQQEGVPNGMSIVDFCQRNGIAYNQFERWFKKRNTSVAPQVHRIRIVNGDMELSGQQSCTHSSEHETGSAESSVKPLRILVSIRTNRGLSVQQGNLTYRQLVALVENLEALC